MSDHSFAARQKRLREMTGTVNPEDLGYERLMRLLYPNQPAVSTSTGGEVENSNLDDNTMKLNLTVQVADVNAIMPLIKTINALNPNVELLDLVETVEPTAIRPRSKQASARTVAGKRTLLRNALSKGRDVEIEYTGGSDPLEPITNRVVHPISFEDDTLLARDSTRGNQLRRFLLNRINKVTNV